jgi:hypothetical protein
MTNTNKEHPPPKEKAALAGGDLEANQRQTHFTQCAEKFKSWKRTLALAFDGVSEAESGDLGLVERNLVESATEMLAVAAEIRSRLRQ